MRLVFDVSVVLRAVTSSVLIVTVIDCYTGNDILSLSITVRHVTAAAAGVVL